MRRRLKSFSQLTNLVEETRGRLALSSQAEAFVYLFLDRILGLSEQASRVAVTHGQFDGGIDAVHVDHEGARVMGCEYLGAHVVACDFADSVAQSRLPIPRSRLDRLVNTWVAIASSTDSGLTLSPRLRQRIGALHRYWKSVESTEVPHDIYFVTNREQSGIDHREIERQMDYFTRHFYHYYELADLVDMEAHHRAEHSGTNERDEDWDDDDDDGINGGSYGECKEEEG